MGSLRILLVMFLTISLSLPGIVTKAAENIAPPADYFPIYNYENDWLIYSNQYKNYVPYSQGVNENARSVSLNIDLIKNRRYYLMIHTDADGYLFLEGALQKKLNEQQWLILNIDSLFKSYQKKEELLLTIYGSAGISGKHVVLGNLRKKNNAGMDVRTSSTLINIKPIPFSSFGNFAVMCLLLILVLNAWVFNTNPLAFYRLINPAEYFNNNPRDLLSKVNKPYSNSIIFFVAIAAMLMSFLLIFFASNELNLFSVDSILSEQANTFQFLYDFLLLTAIFFVLMYGKFILMSVIGNMLNLDKVVDTLFIKIIQSTYLFYAAWFVLIFILGFSKAQWLTSARPYILFPFLIFYISRFISLYVVTKPSTSFINLYLFSYLCVIEIIPLIIGIKFAL
jgi:hypothetical protein